MRMPLKTLRKFDEANLQTLNKILLDLWGIVCGGIEFGDASHTENIYCNTVAFTSDATPGTQFSVSHSLNRVPLGYLVVSKSTSGHVYNGTTANTSAALYLKSDKASMTGVLIII